MRDSKGQAVVEKNEKYSRNGKGKGKANNLKQQ